MKVLSIAAESKIRILKLSSLVKATFIQCFYDMSTFSRHSVVFFFAFVMRCSFSALFQLPFILLFSVPKWKLESEQLPTVNQSAELVCRHQWWLYLPFQPRTGFWDSTEQPTFFGGKHFLHKVPVYQHGRAFDTESSKNFQNFSKFSSFF